jgi:hypothetical protein
LDVSWWENWQSDSPHSTRQVKAFEYTWCLNIQGSKW